jgi:hypothetical protein
MTTATYTQADQIASASRFVTSSQMTLGKVIGSINDVEAAGSEHRLFVDQHEWQFLPSRAKTFGGKFMIQRGWYSPDGVGRAFGHLVADDGSRCTVILK